MGTVNIGTRLRGLTRRRVLTLAIAASLFVSVVPVGATATVITGAPTASLLIDWEMADRCGLDADADGLVDLPNTTEYVHGRLPGSCPSGCLSSLFRVRVLASGVVSAATGEGTRVTLPVASYEWRVRGGGLDLHRWTSRPSLDLVLPESSYDVDLIVRVALPFGTAALRSSGTVVVDDILIVAVGDSYASGDGNPEVADEGSGELWAEGGIDTVSDSWHREARRSTVAWPSRVAMALERMDRRTSVTFVSAATSGATIDRGVVGPASGRASQVDELARLVGGRAIDVALVSVGGNDVGFSEVVRSLVDADPLLDPVCYHLDVAQTLSAAIDGDWTRSTTASFEPPFHLTCRETRKEGKHLAGLLGLPAAFDRLATELQALAPGRVVLTEYPDPSGGAGCSEIVGDAAPWPRLHEIDRPEQAIGLTEVLEPLNRVVADAARRHGWLLADGIAAAFADGHSYCEPWPDYGYPEDYWSQLSVMRAPGEFPSGWYRNPGLALVIPRSQPGVSWYRTAVQSAALQGPSRLYTPGTMHPNELGHGAIAQTVLSVLSSD